MSMNNRLLVITEANEQVASGHLLESIELVGLLRSDGFDTELAVNDDACDAFKHRISGEFFEYHRSVEDDVQYICKYIKNGGFNILVTDLRSVKNEWIKQIKENCDCSIICIDEWGHRQLDCDIIINPMIDPYYWDYGRSKAQLYAGHEYLVLPKKIMDYRITERKTSERINRVCISMGGVDKFGSTVKIAKWLFNSHPDVYVDIILGGGFKYREELENVVNSRKNVCIVQNVNNIYDYFENVDIAFCAGGNTLHELACIGTPAIVVPTMDHEYNNGKRFEEKGFGVTINKSENLSESEFFDAWSRIESLSIRKDMYISGRKLCECCGGNRIVEIVRKVFCCCESKSRK